MEDIYKRIKEIAERKKIQQKEIAESLGVGTNTVNNWFQGNTSMKAEQIPLIARVLRVPISSIFDPKEDLLTLEEPLKDYTRNHDSDALLKQKDETIQAKDETISLLKGQIEYLKSKLES